MSETTNNDDSTSQDWYFTENGQRKSPFPAAALLDFLQTNRISGDTSVWRKGLPDWQPLKSTKLGVPLQDTPPPVAASNINNALIWIVAIAPIPYVVFGAVIDAIQMDDPLQPHRALDLLAFVVPALINAALCLADERQLKRAGYADKWLTAFGFFLAPQSQASATISKLRDHLDCDVRGQHPAIHPVLETAASAHYSAFHVAALS